MNNVMGLYNENMTRWTCKVIDIHYLGYLMVKGLARYLDFCCYFSFLR